MAVKKGETAIVPSATTSYSTTPQSSPKSAFQRFRRKLSPKKSESEDLKTSISKSSSSSDDEIGEAAAVNNWQSNETEMVFRHFDENGDGKISQEELRRCLMALGGEMSEEEAEIAVRSSDADGDGMLGLEDFTKLLEEGGEKEKMEELKEAFKMYTLENGEYITPKSLKRMLNRLGNSNTIDSCKSMISIFDMDGDGVLSFDEFRVMMR